MLKNYKFEKITIKKLTCHYIYGKFFFLDTDPVICASYYCNKHVVKIPIEIAQLLSKIHYELNESEHLDIYYKNPKMISKNIPIYIWIKLSRENYLWTVNLGLALINEYKYRYDKNEHRTEKVLMCLKNDVPLSLPSIGLTPFLMTNKFDMYQFLSNDILLNCRYFYADVKCKNDKWKKRNKPNWFVKIEERIIVDKKKLRKQIKKQIYEKLKDIYKIEPKIILRICYDTLFQGKWQRKAKLMNRFNKTKKLFFQLNFSHLYLIFEISKKMEDIKFFDIYRVQSAKYRKQYYEINFPSNEINYRDKNLYYAYVNNSNGIFIVQPYSNEIYPFVNILSMNNSEKSSTDLYNLFLNYLKNLDYIGADMVRKYIQFAMDQCKAYFNKQKKYIVRDIHEELVGNKIMLNIYKIFEKTLDTIKNNNQYLNWILSHNYMLTDPYEPNHKIFTDKQTLEFY